MRQGALKYPPMTADQQRLVEQNIRLAYRYANSEPLARRVRRLVGRDDVESAALLGLCRAAILYEPSVGAFSTFVWVCIRSDVQRLLYEWRRYHGCGEDGNEPKLTHASHWGRDVGGNTAAESLRDLYMAKFPAPEVPPPEYPDAEEILGRLRNRFRGREWLVAVECLGRGRSHSEVAAELGVSRQRVHQHLEQFRRVAEAIRRGQSARPVGAKTTWLLRRTPKKAKPRRRAEA